MKTCTICGAKKPLGEFSPSSSGKHGRIASCKPCNNERLREYREKKGACMYGGDVKSKACTRCGFEKSLSEFTKQHTGKYGRNARCKKCLSEYHRNYRRRHPEINKKRAAELKQRNTRNRKLFYQWISRQECVICGENDPIVLDLHHRDSTEKNENVAALLIKVDFEKVMDEIVLCDVLCSNCHRKKHLEIKDGMRIARQL